MSRRLPIYALIDSSGSMQGEPIQSVNVGLNTMLTALRQDPYALDTVHLSVITFDVAVNEILPLQPLDQARVDDIQLPRSGATHMGEALNFVCDRVERDVVSSSESQKGDFRPLLFVMTDGSPSDLAAFGDAVARLKRIPFGMIVACAAGPKAKTDYLQQFANQVVRLEHMDSAGFANYFSWVSASIAATASGQQSSHAPGGAPVTLPPPPAEVQVVL